MTDQARVSPLRRRRAGATSLGGVAVVLTGSLLLASAGPAAADAVSVDLGSADSFVVLAGAGTTNTGPTTLNGDIGTFPTTTMEGMESVTVNGANHNGTDAPFIDSGIKNDLLAAYGNARQQATDETISADLGGQTLTSGVYTSGSTMGLTGPLTLNGGADAVFVFQVGSSLTAETGSSVVLTGGVQACNVFWQVEEDATVKAGSAFVGTLMVENSITLGTGATVQGRVLASVGSVTMDTNTITRSTCATPDEEEPGEEEPPVDEEPGDDTPRDETPGATPPTTTAPTPLVSVPQISQIPVGAIDTGSRGSTP